jgi:diguanylate cyclase (GGDEF)-like protein
MGFGKRHIPLGVRLSLLIFLMTLGTGIMIAITSYEFYLAKLRDRYIRAAENIANVAVELIDGETAVLEYFGIAGVISLIIALIFAFIQWELVRRSVVRPINMMAESVNNFLIRDGRDHQKSDQGLKMSSLTEFSVETGDEIESLAAALKNMEKSIWNYIASFDKLSAGDSSDELTGLCDRRTFYDQMNFFIYRGRQSGELHALFVFNLDWFKQINETYGHAMGDQVLKSCADSLKRIFRNSDRIARIGGDIFAVLCKNAGNGEAVKKKAAQIQEAFLGIKPFYLINGITASIGIVIFGDGDVDYGELQQKAFLLIDEIKLQGCNDYRIVHY